MVYMVYIFKTSICFHIAEFIFPTFKNSVCGQGQFFLLIKPVVTIQDKATTLKKVREIHIILSEFLLQSMSAANEYTTILADKPLFL